MPGISKILSKCLLTSEVQTSSNLQGREVSPPEKEGRYLEVFLLCLWNLQMCHRHIVGFQQRVLESHCFSQ